MSTPRIALFFGGPSTEHEISILSARNILASLRAKNYPVELVGINHSHELFHFKNLAALSTLTRLSGLPPEGGSPCTLVRGADGVFIVNLKDFTRIQVDCAFPVLHGAVGEDGSIQGYFELLGLPYVGSGVLASAVGMDKEVMKRLLKEAGILSSPYLCLRPQDKREFSFLAQDFGLPFFIKPSRAGSSVGVFKIRDSAELDQKLRVAFEYDSKVLVEKFIKGREIECSVRGPNESPLASLPGEIIPQHDFYSYEAKYLDENGAILKVPAPLSHPQIKRIQEIACRAYQVLECDGLARVDFFLTETDEIYVNEINTLPGFTKISMYPKMWETSGLKQPELIADLVNQSLLRFQERGRLKTSY